MSDLVTFNVRYEKSLFNLKIEVPDDVIQFIGILKSELLVDNTDELVLLCPTPEGKMMEIKSDEDINFLKKTKLCFNAVSKEIYCSVELVVLVLHEKLPNDPNDQLMILSSKTDKLAFQFNELSQKIDDKLENIASDILRKIRLTFFENLHPNSDSFTKTNATDERKNIPKIEKPNSAERERPQKFKKNKEKCPGSSNDNLTEDSNKKKNSDQIKVVNIDTLLEMLAAEGYSNTIQNIIALKRFDHNYEKALEYLKSSKA